MLSVYKISNKRNKFVYIGMTTRDPQARWKEHLRAAEKVDRRLYRGMRKHGIENFEFEVIATMEDLKEKDIIFEVERAYIEDYNSYWFGYNDTIGGKGVKRPKRGRKGTE